MSVNEGAHLDNESQCAGPCGRWLDDQVLTQIGDDVYCSECAELLAAPRRCMRCGIFEDEKSGSQYNDPASICYSFENGYPEPKADHDWQVWVEPQATVTELRRCAWCSRRIREGETVVELKSGGVLKVMHPPCLETVQAVIAHYPRRLAI